MDLRSCVFIVVAVCLALAGGLQALAGPASFEAGEGAYIAGKFDEARAAYAAAAASTAASPRTRAASLRQLAIMAWRLAGDDAAAEHYFADALALGADVSRTHAERSRFYVERKRFDDAYAAAESAIGSAATKGERLGATLALSTSVRSKLAGVPVSKQRDADRAQLGRARALILELGLAPPLTLALSEALLEVALRLDDGPGVLIAWRSYAREGAEVGVWKPAAQRLAAVLPGWRGRPPSRAERAAIFEGLATSQFFDLAELVANDDRAPGKAEFVANPRVSDVIAYAKLIEDTRAVTDAYYRDVANGKRDAAQWRSSLIALAQSFWGHLHFNGQPPPFSPEALVTELEHRFGAYLSIGQTGGYEDLHYAHIFIDDARTIDQYGHRAQIRRIALDRIVSNGYESWLWDGRQAHGGWARTDRVYQVRPGYADGALAQWELLNDPNLRAEEEDRIARLTAGDDEIARQDPTDYLPGLAARLDWEGLNGILTHLRERGDTDLKQRFIVDFTRIGLDANFFAHEGRHVLDKQAVPSLQAEELEFRAKLSEIAFSEQPRWSYGPIMNANIVDKSSPHGRANKRIMQGLVAWMEKHRASIANLDPARPMLPQFDKLTDEQMREAMRAMDPWAPK